MCVKGLSSPGAAGPGPLRDRHIHAMKMALNFNGIHSALIYFNVERQMNLVSNYIFFSVFGAFNNCCYSCLADAAGRELARRLRRWRPEIAQLALKAGPQILFHFIYCI